MSDKILIVGAFGQIGSELIVALRQKHGKENVVALDINDKVSDELKQQPFEICDATDPEALEKVIQKYNINIIYHMACILSAMGEKVPYKTWRVNMKSLKIVLDLSVKHKLKRVFWPSSIAVFGPTTPKDNTPQSTILEPTTMYGVTKVTGELLCNYFAFKFGLDVRSLRYPGLISWKTPPGGGTTDYAVAIFYDSLKNKKYDCFVREDTTLPMMYMDDAIRATIAIMEAPKENITVRTSYNLAAISFSVKQLAEEIKKHIPELNVTYNPDSRQKIADSWTNSIDDSKARTDWNWNHKFDLPKMTTEMLDKLKIKFSKE